MLFYFGRPKKQIKKLQGVQNNIAWFVTDTRKYDHITQVLIELHFPLVEKRIVFKILLLTFKCLHVLAPSYLSELIVKKQISGASFWQSTWACRAKNLLSNLLS